VSRRQTRSTPVPSPVSQYAGRALREGALYVLFALALYLLVALATYHQDDPSWNYSGSTTIVANSGGWVGAVFADASLHLFGYLAVLIPVMVGFSGWLIWSWQRRDGRFHAALFGLRGVGFLMTALAGSGLASLHLPMLDALVPVDAGGIIGLSVGGGLAGLLSEQGATLVLLGVFLASVVLWTGVSCLALIDALGRSVLWLLSWLWARLRRGCDNLWSRLLRALRARRDPEGERARSGGRAARRGSGRIAPQLGPTLAPPPGAAPAPPGSAKTAGVAVVRTPRAAAGRVASAELGGVAHPPLALLDPPRSGANGYDAAALESMSRLLETRLADFGVTVEVVAVEPGPVITRFEAQPAPGVKVSQITNLAKDLARALSVMRVRVVEVIPGKSVIGIEIPNENRQVIAFSEVINSRDWERAAQQPLALALGKDIGGSPVVVDLGRMPHLLVAGTTGSGKSVGVNAMILSLLFRNTPDDVRLIMIDPKMLELSVYDGIPHLLAPVVTDMKEAANALRWAVGEMERRYRLMASMGVRNIAGFNRKVREAIERGEPIRDPLAPATGESTDDAVSVLAPLPYIVIVVDEFADMMMMVGKKVEELIARLAQKARAAGIHLVLATQRPSVDVITGLIKANIPTRMAFQVSSRIDSRTILDQQGAEALLGNGDMLYLPPGTAMPMRVHGAFVSDAEVHAVVQHIKEQGEPEYIDGLLEGSTPESVELPAALGGAGDADGEQDPLYDQAVRIVTESRKASISGVQRRLKIGYNRAARLVEVMESAGVVGALQANGSREVLAPPPPPG
jgi:DNA segregation ATPase FtsK/SpoIIIE, S-DNA-T family